MNAPDEGRMAREAVRAAITRLVLARGGQATERTLHGMTPATDATVLEPGPPLAAISAVRRVEWAARQALGTHVRYARQDGRTWDEIGEALGLEAGDDGTIGAQAFYRVASGGAFEESFAWVCPSCRATVSDRGPFNGHPADDERGHADDCARLAEAVRLYERQQEDR